MSERKERSLQRDVRNPVFRLPAAEAILALPLDQRRPLGILLRQLADQANAEAERSWKKRKGMMAAYWRIVSTYCKHIARAIDPASGRAALNSGEAR